MANPLYQTAVRALEAALPPRLVSQSLQEGLKEVGKTPETVGLADLEKVLKGTVFKRLQVAQPAAKAKETVQEILAQLETVQVPPMALSPSPQARELEALGRAFEPLKLYFDWEETQALRALLGRLAAHAAGEEAGELIAAAHAQLAALQGRLEEELGQQARELSELEATLAETRGLKSPKVRRLEALTELVRSAQEARQRVGAEVARAQGLARTLQDEAARAREMRLQTFGERLEAAKAAFAPVTALNTDETRSVRRTLDHLSVQWKSISEPASRTQPTTQGDLEPLEAALSDVQAQLGRLQEAAEAVRGVASQLLRENALEAALGFPQARPPDS